MKIGFTGLGQMGRPIALNPLKSGASRSLTDRTPTWFAESEAGGARASISDSKRQQVPSARPGEVESGSPTRTCANRRIYGVSRSYGITE
jgi:hypothetical protein